MELLICWYLWPSKRKSTTIEYWACLRARHDDSSHMVSISRHPTLRQLYTHYSHFLNKVSVARRRSAAYPQSLLGVRRGLGSTRRYYGQRTRREPSNPYSWGGFWDIYTHQGQRQVGKEKTTLLLAAVWHRTLWQTRLEYVAYAQSLLQPKEAWGVEEREENSTSLPETWPLLHHSPGSRTYIYTRLQDSWITYWWVSKHWL